MCMDPATLGLVLAATGTGVNTYNQQRALSKQDKAAAQGIRQQSELQRQASGRTMQHVDEFARSDPSAEQAQSLDGFMNALRASQNSTEGSLRPVAGANPRFAEDVAASRQGLGQESAARAGRMSAIDAPMLQRLRERQQFNTAATDIGELGRQSDATDFLTRLRVNSIQPNPWLGAAAGIMQGAGTGMAMGLGAKAAPSLAGAPTTAAAVSPTGMTADMLARLKKAQNPFAHLPGGI